MDRFEVISAFFDTTVFRNDPLRNTPEFALVKRLGELSRLELHLSEVSRREFISQQESHFDEQLAKVRAALGNIRRRVPDAKLLASAEDEIDGITSQRSILTEEFDCWLADVSSIVHPVAEHHGSRVVTSYFSGDVPFKRIQNRDDFPDAFIFESLADVARESSILHFVTGDKNLAEAASLLPQVEVHASLEAFVHGASLDKFLNRTLNLEKIALSLENEVSHTMSCLSRSILDELIRTDASPMSEEYEFSVTVYGKLEELKIDGGAAEDYGDGMFLVPFTARSTCLVEYFMPKFAWHGLEQSKDRGSAEDWNDNVYRIEQEKELRFAGELGFSVGVKELNRSDISTSDIERIMRNAKPSVRINSISSSGEEPF